MLPKYILLLYTHQHDGFELAIHALDYYHYHYCHYYYDYYYYDATNDDDDDGGDNIVHNIVQ